MLDYAPDFKRDGRRSLLVLRHDRSVHLGCFEGILRDRDISFSCSDLGDLLDLGAHDGILILGGPQSANDPELAAELHFIRQALDAKTPVLGICLGAQLIAKALGAEVHRNPAEEIGWTAVYLTDAAAGDPIFGRLASPSTLFQWHNETFTLPPGAVSLAYSDKCRQQAFRLYDTAYGVQFHPEITPEMIIDWSADSANCGDAGIPGGPLDPNAADSRPVARQILEGWLATF